jgi:hypothetical protein
LPPASSSCKLQQLLLALLLLLPLLQLLQLAAALLTVAAVDIVVGTTLRLPNAELACYLFVRTGKP